MVELTDFLDRRPAALSGGQRQRVALGRAIVREPNVFLMDEPLSNLDAKLRVSTRAQIKHLQHDLKVTTIYVTHDQIEAMTLADRVVVMSKGVIQQVGTPTDIYDHPANTFVASFIGSPAMNLIDGTIANGVFEAPRDARRGPAREALGPVTLGFRAEDAAIVPAGGQIAAPVYSIELLGEASMISYRIGDALVSVKAPKEYRAEIDQTVHAAIPPPSATCSSKAAASWLWARQQPSRDGTEDADARIPEARQARGRPGRGRRQGPRHRRDDPEGHRDPRRRRGARVCPRSSTSTRRRRFRLSPVGDRGADRQGVAARHGGHQLRPGAGAELRPGPARLDDATSRSRRCPA